MLIAPPDFRTILPPRVDQSGRIFRAIEGLEDVFDTKGSGASPEMLRAEMGVLYGYDLQEALATQLTEVDAVEVAVDTVAANTTAQQIFSFPTLPSGGKAAHHRIIRAGMRVTTPGNFDGADFGAQPFGDPTFATLAFVDPASVLTIAGLTTYAIWTPDFSGMWGDRETDYRFRVRSGAGGGTIGQLQLLVAMVPEGVAVPR